MFVKTRVHYIRMCILQIGQVSITNWGSSVLIQIVPKDVTTTQKMKFFIKDFFSTCDQICSFLLTWSHLLKKSLMESFIFLCNVQIDPAQSLEVEVVQSFQTKTSITNWGNTYYKSG